MNYRIKRRLHDVIGYVRYRKGFSQSAEERAVILKIGEAGYNCEQGLARLNRILNETRGDGFDFGRDSVNWLVFACISVKLTDVSRILEIGTFDGEFTQLLARLFPLAEIVTVDLPGFDPLLRSTYKRDIEAVYRSFVERRERNLGHQNIRFIEVNSAFLQDRVEGSFDLVWVDGGHHFPEIAWDLSTAHHICRIGGLIACDDVIPHGSGRLTSNVSSDSAHVLRYMAERTGADLKLFLKRCSFKHAALAHRRKYVAVIERRAYPDARASSQAP